MLEISSATRVDIVLKSAKGEYGHLEVPNGVTVIGDSAFFESEIESIKLPKTLKVIGRCSFSNCKKLRKLEIPYGVREIRYGAFSGCENLEYISIPETVPSIKGDLFSLCDKLKKIVVPIHLVYQAAGETKADIIEVFK